MKALNTLLASVILQSGPHGKFEVLSANAVSASGNVVVGDGMYTDFTNQAFVAVVPHLGVRTDTHDFTGSGMSCIAFHDTSGDVAIWGMNGTAVLNPNTAGVGNVTTTFKIVGSGDFNGDGYSDVLWRDTSGNVAVWEMNGTSILNPNSAGVGNVPTVWTIQDALGQ
jgi:hypothetical protein